MAVALGGWAARLGILIAAVGVVAAAIAWASRTSQDTWSACPPASMMSRTVSRSGSSRRPNTMTLPPAAA